MPSDLVNEPELRRAIDSVLLVLPPEVKERVQNGGARAILDELPAIQKAAQALSTSSLVRLPPFQLSMVRLVQRVDVPSIQSLGAAFYREGTLASPPALGRAELESMHAVIRSVPPEMIGEVNHLLPPATRPLIDYATDMETAEFVQVAEGVANAAAATAAAPPAAAAATSSAASSAASARPSCSDQPGGCSKSPRATHPSVRVDRSAETALPGGTQHPAHAPPADQSSSPAPSDPTGLHPNLSSILNAAMPGAAQLLGSARVVGASQLRLQLRFLR